MAPGQNRPWHEGRGLVAAVALALPFVATPLCALQSTSPRPSAEVTFTKDIAPILQRSCQNCHRPGSVAPMSLITYEEVRPWARSIKHRTGMIGRPDVMPPWYIDKSVGIQHYKDDMSLTSEEIATIARWFDNGAPRGDPADMPVPIAFGDDMVWRLGKPELIVASPSVELQAVQADWWGSLGAVPTGLTEDRYVASVEIREVTDSADEPQDADRRRALAGKKVFHHIIYDVVGGDGKRTAEIQWPAHEAGRNPDIFDPEVGRLLPAGSKVGFWSAHLHASGVRTKAHVEVGFRLHPRGYKPTKKLLNLRVNSSGELDIPGDTTGQKIEAYLVLEQPTKLMIFEPHLHAAGVRMCLEAIWQNTTETLTCAGYNHNWVRVYSYADDAQPLLPKGTILRATSYFDTTPANRNLVDSRNWSGLGHRSTDNMAIGMVTAIELSDQEFEQEMRKRRERLRLTDGQTVIGCPLCGVAKAKEAIAAASR
jgi:hypothetical protein